MPWNLASILRLCCLKALCFAVLAHPCLGEELLWSAPIGEVSEVRVRQKDGIRRLLFWDGSQETEEARMNVEFPDRLAADYLNRMLAAAAWWEVQNQESDSQRLAPRILVVGLGSGLFSRRLARLYPEATVISIEIEPAVATAAQDWFFYQESELVRTVIADGRDYLKSSQDHSWDMIFLDAFDGRSVPSHLRTVEFFHELSACLAPGGLVVANVHYVPFDESLSYQASMSVVFSGGILLPGTFQGVAILPLEPPKGRLELVERLGQRFELPLIDLIQGHLPLSISGASPFTDADL